MAKKAKPKARTIKPYVIASNTSGEEYAPQYVSVRMSPKIAGDLLAYREVFARASEIDELLYCVGYFNYMAYWGKSDFDIGDAWLVIPGFLANTDIAVSGCTMKITSSGVIWAANFKHADGCFESEELSWEDLEAVAAGRNPFKRARKA